MRILHVSSHDHLGGAGMAAFRLHVALRASGVDSSMLVRCKTTSDPHVQEVAAGLRRLPVRVRGWAEQRFLRVLRASGRSLNMFPTGLHRRINESDADVVHLHWVHNEMVSIEEIGRIQKPIVWTLHDMWAYCGAEHHARDERYRVGYDSSARRNGLRRPESEAPSWDQPEYMRPPRWDVDRWCWRRKRRAWKTIRPYFIAPSRWMRNCLRQSVLWGSAPAEVIPNALDTGIFRAMNPAACRKELGLPPDKFIVLFGAYAPMDYNKGLDLLAQAFVHIPEDQRKKTLMVAFGAPHGTFNACADIRWMGVIREESRLAMLYNASNVFVCPSRQETLPTTVAEARACGIPCVGFRTSGLTDLIRHGVDGWLADPYRVGDLADGIVQFFSQGNEMRQWGKTLYPTATDVAQRHAVLYHAVLDSTKAACVFSVPGDR